MWELTFEARELYLLSTIFSILHLHLHLHLHLDVFLRLSLETCDN